MRPPFLYGGAEPLDISGDIVIRVIKSIVEAGRGREFIAAIESGGCDFSGCDLGNISRNYKSLDVLFDEVQRALDNGEDQHISAGNALHIRASPILVNFVKAYLFDNGMHRMNKAARDIVTSARCDPPR